MPNIEPNAQSIWPDFYAQLHFLSKAWFQFARVLPQYLDQKKPFNAPIFIKVSRTSE